MPLSLVALGIVCTVLVGGFFVLARKVASREEYRSSARWLLYFTGTGAAFMLAEVALLKRFELLLGQPVLTLAVVVGGLLLGGGLGSLIAQRLRAEVHARAARIAGLSVAAALVAFAFLTPWLVGLALPLEWPARAGLVLLVLTALGVPMGVLFPIGLRHAAGSS